MLLRVRAEYKHTGKVFSSLLAEYFQGAQIKGMRQAGLWHAYYGLLGKREGKIPVGRNRCSSEDNIKMYFKGIEYKSLDWIRLTQDRSKWQAVVSTVMNSQAASDDGYLLTS